MEIGGAEGSVSRGGQGDVLSSFIAAVTVPSTGWEIRVDYDFNNGGDTSNFIQASYNVTRGGSSIDSGTFLNITSAA